ncbi:hypothetical protein IO44_01415 [Gallibacterium anatis str. Avicor]|uniref:lipopolysaccharide biosynthesis protein n=1 Tax=Gallibacterium anatis TaxID=750 RepID=UPI0005314F5F|nr:polysaccharide biosynthesis C-terminal domain-containing protein [Gallibacterium anatis]KGQ57213.1 hypothetical protein IO44_01415 [Gallibacterium anatis str. Avicor]
MNNKFFVWNTVSSIGLQIIALLCGFVLPKATLLIYGSEINGIVSSITEFLGIIALLEFGVGATVQSALYKPLVKKDGYLLSQVLLSGYNFFKKLAIILVFYLVILVIIFPKLSSFTLLEKEDVSLLIIFIGIGLFSNYYFGIINQLLLTADQKVYIYNCISAITLIINTIGSILLMYSGFSIVAVKCFSSILYFIRPLCLKIYVNKKYNINRNISYIGDPIEQKKDGIVQHFAAYILNKTDVIILTFFTTMIDVSIYSIYNLVVVGVQSIISSFFIGGVSPIFGNLWANKEIGKLKAFFKKVEWSIYFLSVILFGCTSVLIEPFIKLYTQGVTDANYTPPYFGFLMVLAQLIYFFRLPYNMMILAGNHYKQTKYLYYVPALINLFLSIFFVKYYGLIGVMIGTIVALSIQTILMIFYLRKNLIKNSLFSSIKNMSVSIFLFFMTYYLTYDLFNFYGGYFELFYYASMIFIIWIVMSLIVNLIFYKKYIFNVFSFFYKKLRL